MWLETFVNCLETSTRRHSRIDEALALKQQHLPKRIYKYRRDSTNSRDNLKTDTVWLASPESYNDPYDCAFSLSDDRVVAAIMRRFVDTFVTGYKLQDVVSSEQIESARNSPEPLESLVSHIPPELSAARGSNPKLMAEVCAKTTPRLVTDMVSVLRMWRKVTKLCSFSQINDSVLMWSHYAHNHQGFCIEYDLEQLEAIHPLRKFLYPVIYSHQLYDMTPWAEKLADPDLQKFNSECPLLGVLHKFDGWEYEKEWRLVSVTNTVIEDHTFAVPTPTRVYLGSKARVDEHKELLAICEDKTIEVHQMRLADDKFEMLSDPLEQ